MLFPRPVPTGCGVYGDTGHARQRTFLCFKGPRIPSTRTAEALRAKEAAKEHNNRVYLYSLGHALGGGTDDAPEENLNAVMGSHELQLLRLIPRALGEIVPSVELLAGGGFTSLHTRATLGGSDALPPEWTEYNRRMDTIDQAIQEIYKRAERRLLDELDATTLVDEVPALTRVVTAPTVAVSVALVKLIAALRATTTVPPQTFLWDDGRSAVARLQTLSLGAGVAEVLANDDPKYHAQLSAAYAAWEAYCTDVVLPYMAGAALVIRLERADRLSSAYLMYEDDADAIGAVPVDGAYKSGRFMVGWAQSGDDDWVGAQFAHLQSLVASIEAGSLDVDASSLAAYTALAHASTTPGAAKRLGAAVVAGTPATRGGNTRFIQWRDDYTASSYATTAEVAEGELGVLSECPMVSAKISETSMTDEAPLSFSGLRSFEADQIAVTKMGAHAHTHVRLGGRFELGAETLRIGYEKTRNLILSEAWLHQLLPDYLSVSNASIGELAFTAVYAHSHGNTDTVRSRVVWAGRIPETVLEHSWDRLGGVWCEWVHEAFDGVTAFMLDAANSHAERFVK
jgi:hypothetical protein